MTASATAARVLEWAAGPVGSPPRGGLGAAESLEQPDARACELLRQVAVRSCAVLGAGSPPFGDDGPVGLGALLIAAAVGGREDADVARKVLSSVPPVRLAPDPAERSGWADAVARHGVAGPFVAAGAGELTDALLAASPLTALLYRPASGADPLEALETAMVLAGRRRGLRVLTTAFAAPTGDMAALAWRTKVLDRLVNENPDAVLGVYRAARFRHGPEWDGLLERAAAVPVEVRRFWAPLAVLDRKDPDLLRSQPFLDGYRRALDLAAPFVPAEAG